METMLPPDESDARAQRRSRTLFLSGLTILGLALAVLGVLAYQGDVWEATRDDPIAASGSVVWAASFEPLAQNEILNVHFRPDGAETLTLYVVACDDLAALSTGARPATPVASTTSAGSDDLTLTSSDFTRALEPGCASWHAALVWEAAQIPPPHELPEFTAWISAEPLRTPAAIAIGAAGLAGAALVALGALPGRGFLRPTRLPALTGDETMGEAFLRLADRTEVLLERSRAYHLGAGALALVLGYPIALGFSFAVTSANNGAAPALRFMMPAAMLLFLVALTGLWFKRLREMTSELRDWRERIGRLRAIEEGLMSGTGDP